MGRQADRADREAEGHPLRRQPAENALGQDHAASAALAREGRGDHAGHVHARESGDSRAARGKIMRRLLRSLAKGEAITQDTSTLENPAILEQLGRSL
nr:hypothetical protein [Burkholderia dolosa]